MNRTLIAAAALTIIATTGAIVDANRPPLRLRLAVDAGTECVVPDCRTLLGRGPWDDGHKPVDCLAGGPYALPDGRPVWRGCSIIRAEFAVGSSCLPARCSVVAGEDPLEVLP